MANRIGKYKVSKKESVLSAADGATITGKIIVTGLSTNGISLSTGELYTTGSALLAGGATLVAGATAWTASGHSIVCMSS